MESANENDLVFRYEAVEDGLLNHVSIDSINVILRMRSWYTFFICSPGEEILALIVDIILLNV